MPLQDGIKGYNKLGSLLGLKCFVVKKYKAVGPGSLPQLCIHYGCCKFLYFERLGFLLLVVICKRRKVGLL